MSFAIHKCHSSFINVAYVLYFGTNGASYAYAEQAEHIARAISNSLTFEKANF